MKFFKILSIALSYKGYEPVCDKSCIESGNIAGALQAENSDFLIENEILSLHFDDDSSYLGTCDLYKEQLKILDKLNTSNITFIEVFIPNYHTCKFLGATFSFDCMNTGQVCVNFIITPKARTRVHEIGHNFGLYHAETYGTPDDYDDPFSVMGRGSNFSEIHKNYLNWSVPSILSHTSIYKMSLGISNSTVIINEDYNSTLSCKDEKVLVHNFQIFGNMYRGTNLISVLYIGESFYDSKGNYQIVFCKLAYEECLISLNSECDEDEGGGVLFLPPSPPSSSPPPPSPSPPPPMVPPSKVYYAVNSSSGKAIILSLTFFTMSFIFVARLIVV